MIDLKKDCTPAELRAMADALEWANVRTRPQFDPKAKELRAQAERMEAEQEVGPPDAKPVGVVLVEDGWRSGSGSHGRRFSWLTDPTTILHDSELYLAPPDQSEKLAEMEARKDAAYYERNQVVAALAKCFPSGTARTAIEGWSEDWHGCVYIDLPTGQVSWHYHDTHDHLFAGLPAYTGEWDGHSTDAKYSRLSALIPQPDQSAKIAELTAALDEHERLARRTQAAQNERIKKLEEALKELLLELDPDDWMIDFIRAALLAKVE